MTRQRVEADASVAGPFGGRAEHVCRRVWAIASPGIGLSVMVAGRGCTKASGPLFIDGYNHHTWRNDAATFEFS